MRVGTDTSSEQRASPTRRRAWNGCCITTEHGTKTAVFQLRLQRAMLFECGHAMTSWRAPVSKRFISVNKGTQAGRILMHTKVCGRGNLDWASCNAVCASVRQRFSRQSYLTGCGYLLVTLQGSEVSAQDATGVP